MYINNDVNVGGGASFREVHVLNEMDHVGTLVGSVFEALCKAADFVHAPLDPGGTVGPMDELAIVK